MELYYLVKIPYARSGSAGMLSGRPTAVPAGPSASFAAGPTASFAAGPIALAVTGLIALDAAGLQIFAEPAELLL